MNDLDDTTFAQFTGRFARIEALVPDPPRPALRLERSRRYGVAVLARSVVLLGVLLLLAAVVLSAIGSRAPAVTVPPDSAPPAVVLDAYLQALRAGDCETASRLTLPVLFGDGHLCGATRVIAFSIDDRDPFWHTGNEVGFVTWLTTTGTAGGLPAGEIAMGYMLQQQSSGAWRIIEETVAYVPPALLPTPPSN